jgi:hypothetical protein
MRILVGGSGEVLGSVALTLSRCVDGGVKNSWGGEGESRSGDTRADGDGGLRGEGSVGGDLNVLVAGWASWSCGVRVR